MNMNTNNQERIREMVAMRRQGMSGTEIGRALGITRQRVEQISRQMSPEDKALFARGTVPYKTWVEKAERACPCGKTFITYPKSKHPQKYCSPHCYAQYGVIGYNPNVPAEVRAQGTRAIRNWRYAHDQEFRERMRASQARSRINVGPVRAAARRKQMREYYQRVTLPKKLAEAGN